MNIPLVDLQWQHEIIATQVIEGWQRVVASAEYVLGSEVSKFEEEFASFSDVRHCVGVGNGTDAIELALRAVDVRHGDEVIVPANSFIATALAVVRAGGLPVLVDCDPQSYVLDLACVEKALTKRTRAIVPVHLYGQMAPMKALCSLAESYGVDVIEDAAQAHGAAQDGSSPGTFGALAATSFYPGKNLGGYGDGGAVLTNSDELAARVRALRNYGSVAKYDHPRVGFNSRLDALQAVVLRAKLTHLSAWNDHRGVLASRYTALLAVEPRIHLPTVLPGNRHVWHLFVIRVTDRDRVLSGLRDRGIAAGIHYPRPIHLHDAFKYLGLVNGAFPHSEVIAETVVSLPLFPGMTELAQERVVSALLELVNNDSGRLH